MDGLHLDPIVGFILPGAGDIVSAGLGLYPVVLAWRSRAPKVLLARMLLNLSVDLVSGAVPLLGDIWDFFFRAHRKNLRLLRERAEGRQLTSRPGDTLVVVGAAAVFVAALAVPIVVLVKLISLAF